MHLSNLQVCALASLERDRCNAKLLAPGPLRNRLARGAGPGAVVALTEPPSHHGPAFVIALDGHVVQVDGVQFEPPYEQEPLWPG